MKHTKHWITALTALVLAKILPVGWTDEFYTIPGCRQSKQPESQVVDKLKNPSPTKWATKITWIPGGRTSDCDIKDRR